MTRYVGLDLSTKTGVCILAPDGEIIFTEEYVYQNVDTPEIMMQLIFDVMHCVSEKDVVVIEGFGYASKSGFLLGGIGWAVRMELYKRNIPFYLAAPTALKKYATGSGKADKRKVAVEVNKRWGFYDDSDNITDAYVLAQIGRGLNGEYEPIKTQRDVLKKITG